MQNAFRTLIEADKWLLLANECRKTVPSRSFGIYANERPPQQPHVVWSRGYTYLVLLTDWIKVLRPTRYKTGHFRELLPSQSITLVPKKLNVTQPNIRVQENRTIGLATTTHQIKYKKLNPVWSPWRRPIYSFRCPRLTGHLAVLGLQMVSLEPTRTASVLSAFSWSCYHPHQSAVSAIQALSHCNANVM